jgi:cytidine deaminase
MALKPAGKKKLIALAVKIRTNAYAPYSNYKVGVPLWDLRGTLRNFQRCNSR